jgi:hypothetical protein
MPDVAMVQLSQGIHLTEIYEAAKEWSRHFAKAFCSWEKCTSL